MRRNFLMVHTGHVAGRKRVYVPKQIEAFGLVCYENYYPKWKAIADKKSEDADFKPPKSYKSGKDDPELEKYIKCTWSSSIAGQGKGWDRAVFKVIKERKACITKARDEDQKNNWPKLKKGLQLLRDAAGIEGNELWLTRAQSKKRKNCDSSEDDFIDDRDQDDLSMGDSVDEEENYEFDD